MIKMPTTSEQIEKNRVFIRNEISRLHKIAEANNLIYVCCVHWAPLSECLESRVAFFEEMYEARIWQGRMDEIYSSSDLPYEIYIGQNLFR